MGFCPVPHTSREQFWLCFGAGLSLSVNLLYTFYSRKRERSAGNRLIEASLGAPKKVVDLPERTICEYVGNAATADPSISIAVSNITKSCTEGPQTNQFDEWVIALEGDLKVFCHASKNILSCSAGEALYLPKGTYKYIFDNEKTKYIAICMPAFAPNLVSFQNPDP
mmetsp:Transcript_14918/g.18449  ORF Transcript_14918/g.18449 Transcript_14918/m.18449 type:complete len:167 (+) Transcript_14918:430-930(+)